MDLNLSDEQRLIVDSAAEFLAAQSSSARVRSISEQPGQWDQALWEGLSALGWCGIHLPESQQGLGLGVVELCLLQEQLGMHLACVPYFDTVALAASVLHELHAHPAVAPVLSALAQGQARSVLALPEPDAAITARAQACSGGWQLSGLWPQVGSAPLATHLLLPAPDAEGQTRLFLLPADSAGLAVQAQPALDATRLHGQVHAHNCLVRDDQCMAAGPALDALLQHTRCLAAVALAAEQVGVAQKALDLTLAYTLERQQFEKPIASFQAVKHRCAQMLVALETARSAVYGAACIADTRPDAATLLHFAAQARSEATEAALFCTREAIQLHGGVGFTWEYDPHLYFRRAQASSQRLGALRWWREQVARQWLDNEALTP